MASVKTNEMLARLALESGKLLPGSEKRVKLALEALHGARLFDAARTLSGPGIGGSCHAGAHAVDAAEDELDEAVHDLHFNPEA